MKKLFGFLLLVIFFQCNYLTTDTECEKQKNATNRCINSFYLYCLGNKTRTECDGSLQSTLFIGSLCNYKTSCTSSSEDVVKESIQPRGKE
ncbi:MAG TPA: hypothetical protein PK079_20130 [Leptospiraceae bacterium]|nr:hypothetical protein [Leptospiraceae bacterium]HMW08250.1 hypothetical protein [Leptospiraceae bacterium]HMX35077.1 hypothetical protein [Leptospiraceae bacterium]HMY34016.1 hypothetical protein [Leptospiraceae bacterium]HMZ66330.1 hypothetical protein [Leptospiraceae bacterium]